MVTEQDEYGQRYVLDFPFELTRQARHSSAVAGSFALVTTIHAL